MPQLRPTACVADFTPIMDKSGSRSDVHVLVIEAGKHIDPTRLVDVKRHIMSISWILWLAHRTKTQACSEGLDIQVSGLLVLKAEAHLAKQVSYSPNFRIIII